MIHLARIQFPSVYTLDLFMRPRVRALFIRLFLFLSLGAFFFFALARALVGLETPFTIHDPYPLLGLGFFMLGFFIACASIEVFYRSNKEALALFVPSGGEVAVRSEVARLFAYLHFSLEPEVTFSDTWRAFLKTDFLQVLFVRLGIAVADFQEVPDAAREARSLNTKEFFTEICGRIDKRGVSLVSIADILDLLAERDSAFRSFLFDRKIQRETLMGAAAWIEEEFEREGERSRWWLRENLARIPGIAKDLGYGYTYNLDQYARELEWSSTRFVREARAKEIEALERALARTNEANVLLVGEEGSGKHAIVDGLAEWIREGRVVPQLEHKRVILFDGSSIEASTKNKGAYEEVMIKVFNEAVRAGNIIIVIDNFASFISSASALGVDVIDLLGRYIGGSDIQVIALADIASFHKDLEPNGKITKLFEKIDIEEPDTPRALRMLEDSCLLLEATSGKVFTYQSLARAEELARRFITEGAMPEKAIDLLDEAASSASPETVLIVADHIDEVVKRRTAIPTKDADTAERGVLLKLEELLHARVVGQERAVSVISDALRRARTGLRAGTRPVGSFLFLGPTGVGKTETAKALAEVYFRGAGAMVRFDMSEFQGPDGMAKLIGAFDSQTPGVLASRLREKPFSLLLFDEFEKASREVQNLFLQILDEGIFRDAYGRKVSARETMIIATSNAGASMIWDLLRAGKDPAAIQDSVVDGIRREGILLPELLNRFDALVVFHPLAPAELEQVALLILRDLARQLEKQDIHFNPSRELAAKIVEIGYDPTFGARPMRRAVQDRVEQIISRKILEGTLNRGDSFSFSQAEVDKL